MRNLVILFILLFSGVSYSQSNFGIKASYNGSSMDVIWIPSDYKLLQSGIDSGYSIVRYTTKTNTQTLTDTAYENSKVVLKTAFKPLSKSGIEAFNMSPYTTEWDKIGAGILYDTLETEIEFTSPAIKAIKQKEDHAFDMAYLGFALGVKDLGVSLGLKLRDSTAISGYEYLYFIFNGNTNLNGVNLIPLAVIKQSAQILTFTNVPKPKAFGSGNKIVLEWSKSKIEEEYIGYNIYRSMNGSAYTKVNNEPYLALSSPELKSFLFADSVQYTKRNYSYKIEGVNYFSGTGGISDTVQFKPMPEPLDYYPLIDSVQNIGNVSFKVYWKFPSHVVGAISGYKVKRALSVDAPYTQIGSVIPVASPSYYLDVSAPGTAYYKVIAIDTNSYELESIPYMAQLDDTIPCSIPNGLTATAYKDNRIVFSWTPVTESDLSGYKIFMGQKQVGGYNEITTDLVTGNSYTYSFDMKTLRKDLYFKINSVDNHGNYSEQSTFVKVDLPDVVPPSPPILKELIQGQGFITLKYYTSSSEDAKWHFIQRKSKNQPQWEEVGKFLKPSAADSLLRSYKDTLVLTNQEYKYRVLCKDLSGNNGISSELSGQPYAPAVRNKKPDFACDFKTVNSKKCISVKGGFDNLDENEITDILIFRAIGNSPMLLLNQVSKIDVDQYFTTYGRLYIDKELLFGQAKTYKYRFQILYWDGSMSKMSDEIAINYTP